MRRWTPRRFRREWAVAARGNFAWTGELWPCQPGLASDHPGYAELHSHRVADSARVGRARNLQRIERGGLLCGAPEGPRFRHSAGRLESAFAEAAVEPRPDRIEDGGGECKLPQYGFPDVLLPGRRTSGSPSLLSQGSVAACVWPQCGGVYLGKRDAAAAPLGGSKIKSIRYCVL